MLHSNNTNTRGKPKCENRCLGRVNFSYCGQECFLFLKLFLPEGAKTRQGRSDLNKISHCRHRIVTSRVLIEGLIMENHLLFILIVISPLPGGPYTVSRACPSVCLSEVVSIAKGMTYTKNELVYALDQ